MSVKLLEVELASSTDRIDDVVYEQMQAVADRYLAMGSARIYHNDAARQATCAAADCYRMCCDYAASAVGASTAARAALHQGHGGVGHGLCESGERRVGRLEADDGGRAVPGCVESNFTARSC